MLYCDISSTVFLPTPWRHHSLLSWAVISGVIPTRGWRPSRRNRSVMSFSNFCPAFSSPYCWDLRHANTLLICLIVLTSGFQVSFLLAVVRTSATRSAGSRRRAYRWRERLASSGAWQMKVLRNKDSLLTHQGKSVIPSGQVNCLLTIRRCLYNFTLIIDSNYWMVQTSSRVLITGAEVNTLEVWHLSLQLPHRASPHWETWSGINLLQKLLLWQRWGR